MTPQTAPTGGYAQGPDVLFDMEPAVVITEPVEKLSAQRRLTLRQRADIANGRHPLTRRRIHEDPARTCGNCAFRQKLDRWHKCVYGDFARVTHSVSSDVRAFWPACGDHEYGDPKVSPDAARWVPQP
jgi:hypothetical protein